MATKSGKKYLIFGFLYSILGFLAALLFFVTWAIYSSSSWAQCSLMIYFNKEATRSEIVQSIGSMRFFLTADEMSSVGKIGGNIFAKISPSKHLQVVNELERAKKDKAIRNFIIQSRNQNEVSILLPEDGIEKMELYQFFESIDGLDIRTNFPRHDYIARINPPPASTASIRDMISFDLLYRLFQLKDKFSSIITKVYKSCVMPELIIGF